ncbi:hypothetical protein LR48_Vigan09g087400 [Vigna angularis]|uniref:Uncharacterized protein n=1 Tax=Phaseolus angularis TaxID=3914 RepID=A0A0L9VAX3_PHAAN|nr:hypothetical protein LR48_Vigan09g087400 [Vigna angularis]
MQGSQDNYGIHCWHIRIRHSTTLNVLPPREIGLQKKATELGRVVHVDEVFTQTHILKGTNTYVDERSRKTIEDFSTRLTQVRLEVGSAPDNDSRVDADDDMIKTQCWVEVVGGKKKGQLCGVGQLASNYSAGRGGILKHQPSTSSTFDHNNVVSREAYDSFLARFDNLENLVRTLIPQFPFIIGYNAQTNLLGIMHKTTCTGKWYVRYGRPYRRLELVGNANIGFALPTALPLGNYQQPKVVANAIQFRPALPRVFFPRCGCGKKIHFNHGCEKRISLSVDNSFDHGCRKWVLFDCGCRMRIGLVLGMAKKFVGKAGTRASSGRVAGRHYPCLSRPDPLSSLTGAPWQGDSNLLVLMNK